MTSWTMLAVLAAALWTASAPTPARAQVAVMERVPTVSELRDALRRAPAQPRATPEEGSRGIEWTQPGAAPGAAPARPTVPAASKDSTADAGADRPRPAPATGPAVALPIQFDLNSARLSAASAGYVQAIAQLLAQDASLRLTVEGHTDASGDATRNLMLSWDRAMTVFRTLVERHGIDPQRLQPVGRGALEPLDGLAPTAPMNRRVQFRVVG